MERGAFLEWTFKRKGCTYAALKLAHEHGPEECTSILRVSNVLESFGSVLASLGDQNLVTTGVL